MAFYGWHHWKKGTDHGRSLPVINWPMAFHLLPLLMIAILTVLSGFLLSEYSDAALPYLDSFTTWGAIFATWMVAHKVLQNWHYWFVIDALSVFIYISRGLWLTALLYLLYLLLIVAGFRVWRTSSPPPVC
jgi:nicotinamide mononucleotide transporter